MRGFRGSRAAQNQIASRFGKMDQYGNNRDHSHESKNETHQAQRQTLPEWLKTPETKALEKRGSMNPQLKLVSQPAPVAVKAPVATAMKKPAPKRAKVTAKKPRAASVKSVTVKRKKAA